MPTNAWFDVDREGLASLLEARGRAFAIHELIQNAWDQQVTQVDVELTPIPRTRLVRISVRDDDPEGFASLADAYTLFAPSQKRADPTRRGRFNLGEKLVLALCGRASLTTTTGSLVFDGQGRRHYPRRRSAAGSVFVGEIRMTREQLADTLTELHRLLPPPGIATRINGTALEPRLPLRVLGGITLTTEIDDDQGTLRRTRRQTSIDLHAPLAGETPHLYELGIPVCTLDLPWHCNVAQKVPLTLDRASVLPSFLRDVEVAVLNAAHDLLPDDSATRGWVDEALADPRVTDTAVTTVIRQRFGERAVVYDPSDAEANKIALDRGYTVVTGSQLGKAQWAQVRRSRALLPAGQVTPSPKPFHPDGAPLTMLPESDWSAGLAEFVEYAQAAHRAVVGDGIVVVVANDPGWGFQAVYAPGRLIVNVGVVGQEWYVADSSRVDRLLIHEFAHPQTGDHLSESFHEGLCSVAAAMRRWRWKGREPRA